MEILIAVLVGFLVACVVVLGFTVRHLLLKLKAVKEVLDSHDAMFEVQADNKELEAVKVVMNKNNETVLALINKLDMKVISLGGLQARTRGSVAGHQPSP